MNVRSVVFGVRSQDVAQWLPDWKPTEIGIHASSPDDVIGESRLTKMPGGATE